LQLADERVSTLEIDFDDWLARGSGHDDVALVERALVEPPGRSECFDVVIADDGRRLLRHRVWLSLWRR
jgi:hypothetical protein